MQIAFAAQCPATRPAGRDLAGAGPELNCLKSNVKAVS